VSATKEADVGGRCTFVTVGAKVAARANVTLESLVEMQRKLYDRALDSGQLSAGVAAGKEISVLTGHRVERAEIGAPGEFDDAG
jgi:hypothetical protein